VAIVHDDVLVAVHVNKRSDHVRMSLAHSWPPLAQSHNDTSTSAVPTLSMCMAPLHDGHYTWLELAHFFEYYRLMGVDHFVIYLHSGINSKASRAFLHTSSTMERVLQIGTLLKTYEDMNVVTVLRWPVPDLPTSSYHYFNQVVSAMLRECPVTVQMALHQCLLRTRYFTDFVAAFDYDEYFVTLNAGEHLDGLKRLVQNMFTANTVCDDYTHTQYRVQYICILLGC
jgi:hypothetical protein